MMRFLLSWLGVWPAPGRLRVAPSARRMLPDAEGAVRPLVGVVSPRGAALSVSPLVFGDVRRVVSAASVRGGLPAVLAELPAVLGLEHQQVEVRDMWWASSPLRLRPAAAPAGSRPRLLAHSPLGMEVVPAAGDLGQRSEQVAHAVDRAVARGTVALMTAPTGEAAAAQVARAAGFREDPWQLLRLTAPARDDGTS